MSDCWFVLNSGPGAAAENMAVDEALLEVAPRLGQPVLRFYGWCESAATFGYFQKYAEVERFTPLRPLIRRPTGGGLVPHNADWTYSLVFPPNDPWYGLKAVESYRRVHEWIQAAFARLETTTELAPQSFKEIPGQCFVGAEQFDVLWQQRKIAGAAQRRTKHGLLIQGSIQPPPGVERGEFEESLRQIGSARGQVEWKPLRLTAEVQTRIAELAQLKYSQESFNRRR